MSKGNPFLALRLACDQHDAVRAKAAESGMTVSEMVRHAITHYVAAGGLAPSPAQRRTATRPRAASRPVRLQRTINELEGLLADYEDWQANLPGSLEDTATAAVLAETVDNMQQALDLLNAITPPRGYGRD
jgi:hypothetical protein